MKKFLINFLKVALPLSFGIFLIWFIYKDLTEQDKIDITESFKKANYWLVGLSLILGVLSHVSRAVRWNMLIEPLGFKPKLYNTFFAVMIGYVSTMAFHRVGEVIRAGVMKRYEGIPMNKAFGTVITERAVDTLCLAIIMMVAFITQFKVLSGFYFKELHDPLFAKVAAFSDQYFSFTYILVGFAGLIIAGVVFVLSKRGEDSIFSKVVAMVIGLWEGVKSIRRIKNIWAFIGHTLFIWTMYFLMIYICFYSIPEMAGMSLLVAMAVFVMGSLGIIVVQGGIGAYPAIVMKTLMIYGLPKAIGFAFGWIVWTAQALLLVVLGLGSLALIQVLNKNKHHGQQEKHPA
jgi:uncharacterized protein (TIRG00374 family)